MHRRYIAGILSLIMCLALLCSMSAPAFAEEGGIIDEAALEKLTEDFLQEKGIDPEDFSVGFCYTATGEEWYFNGDKWFYPASMYKVPLIMLLSEQEARGEINGDDLLYDKTFAEVEQLILTYSNNDWAHHVRSYLGGDEIWRQDAKKYAQLKDGDYDPDYMDYCYFSNRFMTQVMKTLYSSPESYPNVLDCLLLAEPEHYFRLYMEGRYDIAQKYGSFSDQLGQSFNHTTGIVYTENPCIITVMTCNVGGYESVIAEMAQRLVEYSLSLDAGLDDFKQEEQQRAEQEADEQRRAEEEAQEQKRLDELRAKEEAEAERQRQQAEEAARKKKEFIKSAVTVLIIIAAAAVIIMAVAASIKKKQQQKRRAAAKARQREERQHYDTPPEERRRSDRYTPKH